MRKSLDKETTATLKQVGNRIREKRIEKGFTNAEIFAYENEISRSQYARYEQGEDLKMSSLLRVLKGLDISLAEFFAEGFDD